ncbi:MAG: hypothetical protein V7K97_05350 [Nostoc sp.]|uniref:hypothetical protein n=1 Tax=Nostoc sp. TaxID=1180 RepID=UPI002FF4C3E2
MRSPLIFEGIGHWALVPSVVVGAASRREVLGIGHWALVPSVVVGAASRREVLGMGNGAWGRSYLFGQ